jgi:hypothetical protein
MLERASQDKHFLDQRLQQATTEYCSTGQSPSCYCKLDQHTGRRCCDDSMARFADKLYKMRCAVAVAYLRLWVCGFSLGELRLKRAGPRWRITRVGQVEQDQFGVSVALI